MIEPVYPLSLSLRFCLVGLSLLFVVLAAVGIYSVAFWIGARFVR